MKIYLTTAVTSSKKTLILMQRGHFIFFPGDTLNISRPKVLVTARFLVLYFICNLYSMSGKGKSKPGPKPDDVESRFRDLAKIDLSAAEHKFYLGLALSGVLEVRLETSVSMTLVLHSTCHSFPFMYQMASFSEHNAEEESRRTVLSLCGSLS